MTISCVFAILSLLAKDHFFDPINFCTCKTVMCGAFLFVFFKYQQPFPMHPFAIETHARLGININDILCTVLLS